VARFAALIPADGAVLDLAAGNGRHTRLLLERGRRVVAADLDTRGLADLAGTPGLEIVKADLEGAPLPFGHRRFTGIVVTNYLHRPLLPRLRDLLAPGGVLIYETFAQGNQRFGRPSTHAYLLKAGELLDLVRGHLQVVAYEHGEVATPKAAVMQRLCAVADLTPDAELDGSPRPYPLPLA